MLSSACTKQTHRSYAIGRRQATADGTIIEVCAIEQHRGHPPPPNTRPPPAHTSCPAPGRSLFHAPAVKWTKTKRLHSERY